MIPRYPTDASHSAIATIAANLTRLDADTVGALEARRAHLRELALAIAAEAPSAEQLLDRLGAASPARLYRPEALRDNLPFLGAAMDGLSLLERVELCRMVCEALPSPLSSAALIDPPEPLSEGVEGLIAYLQNAFTDHAYHIFSERMVRARSQYHESYGAACEAVAGGSCAACILPIEHAQDGKLLGFYRLIDRYELKIVASCDIAQAGGIESRFALLQKNLDPILPKQADAYYFEFSITRSSGTLLGAMLDAAVYCGLEVRRVDSIPLAYAEDSFAYHAVLSLPSREALIPYLLYLALDIPQYEPIGIYAHLPA